MYSHDLDRLINYRFKGIGPKTRKYYLLEKQTTVNPRNEFIKQLYSNKTLYYHYDPNRKIEAVEVSEKEKISKFENFPKSNIVVNLLFTQTTTLWSTLWNTGTSGSPTKPDRISKSPSMSFVWTLTKINVSKTL